MKLSLGIIFVAAVVAQQMVQVTEEDLAQALTSKFDIPMSQANYTDARGGVHPLWTKPFFEREYQTFDDVFTDS